MSKAKNGVANKKWELIGDSIINLVIAEHLESLPEKINDIYAPHYLRSNTHLALLAHKIPITFKYPDKGTEYLKNNSSEVRKGDEVEYYVAFLYINHGLEKARDFLVKNLFTINFLQNETVSST